jgi:hypothetical protein
MLAFGVRHIDIPSSYKVGNLRERRDRVEARTGAHMDHGLWDPAMDGGQNNVRDPTCQASFELA